MHSKQRIDGRCAKFNTSLSPLLSPQTKRPEPLRLWPGVLVERVTGIEPALEAWKASVLPLNHTRDWSGRQDSNLRHPAPKAGALPDCATSRNSAESIAEPSLTSKSAGFCVWESLGTPYGPFRCKILRLGELAGSVRLSQTQNPAQNLWARC